MLLTFARPTFLALLPAAALALWWSARGSYAGLRGGRRVAACVTRSLMILALILALAGAQLNKRSESTVVVFLDDVSYSVAPEEKTRALEFVRGAMGHHRPQDRGALVLFGRDAMVESESLRTPADVQPHSQPAGTHTNIAGALRVAVGLVPPGSAGKLVLLSDGNENIGSAAREVLLAQASHLPIDIVPLKSRTMTDTLVREVSVPSEARKGETVPLRATVESTSPQQGALTVTVDDVPVQRKSVTVGAGTTTLELSTVMPQAGFHKVEVLFDSPNGQCKENDRGAGFVRVRGEPRVLIADEAPAEVRPLCRLLQGQGITVDAGGAASIPTSPADLERYDGIFLSNLPAYRMTVKQMAMLRDATRDLGVGLGMIGGEYSFGAGGYYQTPVEEALPVSMDATKDRAFPAATVIIIVDTSGSMGMIEDGVEKIQLAAEGAVAVVDLLQPYDALGVVVSDPSPTVLAQPHRLDNKASVCDDIRSLRAGGGGIYCQPCLQIAYQLMHEAKTPIRHIIMLADGSDCDNQPGCVDLVRGMADEKITTTTIAFGDGHDVPFLKDVASAGRGEFYLTDKGQDLKRIFTRETLTIAKSVLVEERFQARPSDASAITQGIDWESAPPLLGYVATSRKSLSTLPLVTHKADPLLACWQYGLGRSIAFTSDARAHWAAYWMRWPGSTRLWGQAAHWMMRQLSSGLLHIRTEREGDRARIIADALREDGRPVNGLEVRGTVDLPDGGRQEVALEQTGPGRYETTIEAAAVGSYVASLTAHGSEGSAAHQTAGFAVPYPPDYADTRANEGALTSLAEQTGGQTLTDPAQAFAYSDVMPRVPVDIWRTLLWLAAMLLPLDVAVRRLLVSREDVATITQPILALLGGLRRKRTVQRSATIGRLMDRKQARKAGEPTAPRPEPEAPIFQQPPPTPGSERPDTPAPPAVPSTPHTSETDAGGSSAAARLAARKRRMRQDDE